MYWLPGCLTRWVELGFVDRLDLRAITAVDIAIVRSTTNCLLPQYLSYYFNSAECLRKMNGLAIGTTRKRLRRSDIATLLFPLPPLPEQRAIAKVLDSIDEAIEDTEAVVAATKRLRDALLHRLLTRGVPGWHSEWKDVRGLGTIPASWDVVRLGDVAEIQTGRAVSRKARYKTGVEIPYLSVANVKDGYLDLGVVKTMLVSEREVSRYKLSGRGTCYSQRVAMQTN